MQNITVASDAASIIPNAALKNQQFQAKSGRSRHPKSLLPKIQRLIIKGQFSSALELIESKLGYVGDTAVFALALAQYLALPLPSGKGGEA